MTQRPSEAAAGEGPNWVIAVCADDRYALLGAMALYSVALYGDPARRASLLLLDAGISAAQMTRIRRVFSTVPQSLSVLPLDAARIEGTAWLYKGTIAANGRLILPELAGPKSRLLYLDCDTLTGASLAPLLALDLAGHTVAAVRDPQLWSVKDSRRPGPLLRGGMAPDDPYFNSGVMIVDVQAWLEKRIGERTIELLRAEPDFRLGDQDALNVVLRGDWMTLQGTWNWTGTTLPAAGPPPAIVHFMGRKPAFPGCTHPRRDAFRKIVRDSGWFSPLEYAVWRARVSDPATAISSVPYRVRTWRKPAGRLLRWVRSRRWPLLPAPDRSRDEG